jgi:hypothetical protein
VALTFKRARPRTGIVAERLRTLDPRWTGAIVARHDDAIARIYCYESEIYAVDLSSYRPDVASRLVAGGVITPEQATTAVQVDGDPDDFPIALVDSGACSAENLAVVHAEIMLACLGAVLAADREVEMDVALQPGATTSVGCAIPVSVPALLTALDLRRARLESDVRALRDAAGSSPDAPDAPGWPAGTLWVVTADEPANTSEARALVSALHGTSLDVAAGRCGFTRAEAVHLAAALAAARVIEPTSSPSSARSGCPVPEAWPGCA